MAQEHRQSIRRDPGICKEQVPEPAGMPLHHRDAGEVPAIPHRKQLRFAECITRNKPTGLCS